MAIPTQLRLQVVSADKALVNETVDEVEIPGADGYFGVLPGHTPLLALLGAGEMWYRRGTTTQHLVIAFGFAEVQPDAVTILAQIAEKADEIDVARAEAAKRRAEERLARPTIDMDFERARLALLKSLGIVLIPVGTFWGGLTQLAPVLASLEPTTWALSVGLILLLVAIALVEALIRAVTLPPWAAAYRELFADRS